MCRSAILNGSSEGDFEFGAFAFHLEGLRIFASDRRQYERMRLTQGKVVHRPIGARAKIAGKPHQEFASLSRAEIVGMSHRRHYDAVGRARLITACEAPKTKR